MPPDEANQDSPHSQQGGEARLAQPSSESPNLVDLLDCIIETHLDNYNAGYVDT
jgi:hypothetical protein